MDSREGLSHRTRHLCGQEVVNCNIIATLRGSLERMQCRYAKGMHALHIVRWKRKKEAFNGPK